MKFCMSITYLVRVPTAQGKQKMAKINPVMEKAWSLAKTHGNLHAQVVDLPILKMKDLQFSLSSSPIFSSDTIG